MGRQVFTIDDTTKEMPGDVLGTLDRRFARTGAASYSLPPSAASGLSVTESSAPKPVDRFALRTWGTGGGAIHFSTNAGASWTNFCPSPDGDAVRRLIETADGEVICATGAAIYKSNGWSTGAPTWTKKVAANGTAQFFPFNVAGNGQKFVATQYSASNRPDSRYGHISLDGGTTWVQAWDSVALFGQAASDLSHVHGCEYDDRSGRFYITEGHGDIAGVYYSSDNGASWVRPPGLVQNPAPTVIVATDDGLVCGSDHAQAGVYGIIRQNDPTKETLRRIYAWRTGRSGVVGFGLRGYRDPATGIVYIGFRSEFADVPPIIAGGTAAAAALVYEWPTAPVTASDAFGAVIVDAQTLTSSATVNGTDYTVRGRVTAPSTSTDDPGGLLGGMALDGRSLAVGAKSSTGGSPSSVALGAASSVSATQQGTAVGAGATVTGSNGVALGDAASSGGTGVAVGSGATTNAFGGAVVVGSGAAVTGGGQGTVVGAGAASAAQSTVIGYQARSTGSNSAAVGLGASTANDGVALGAGATSGGSQTALGRNAVAGHAGSTALGKDTATTGANQTAVGPRTINLRNLTAAPATIADSGSLYVLNGALVFKGASGTVTVVAPA